METGEEHMVRARVIINATGIFTDDLRKLDDALTPPLLSVSRGTHIVVGPEVLGGAAGIMVPKTKDGRVIFAIPWQGKVVIGTTDIPANKPEMEPGHVDSEVDFLIETINPYLVRGIDRGDIVSVFSGLRPLVTGKASKTSKLSREHHIDVSPKGLVTIAGGKWTTYRRMAQDVLDFVAREGMIEPHPCITGTVKLRGAWHDGQANHAIEEPALREYGSDAAAILALAEGDTALAQKIDPRLPYTLAQALYAVRYEMARTIQDVLARRTRSLLLDAKAALRAAPAVASLMALELGRSQSWIDGQIAEFKTLVESSYSLSS